LFSAKSGCDIGGDVEFSQQINGDLSATMRRNVTFSGYIYNGSGLVLSPKLNIYTADAFNNFSAITLRSTINLQSGANASWTYTSATIDLSTVTNVANGLLLAILLSAGALNDPSKNVLFSRLKVQIGEVATEFVDDPSLFIQTPVLTRPCCRTGALRDRACFQPNVIPAALIRRSRSRMEISMTVRSTGALWRRRRSSLIWAIRQSTKRATRQSGQTA
jgi:hypothetical protein